MVLFLCSVFFISIPLHVNASNNMDLINVATLVCLTLSVSLCLLSGQPSGSGEFPLSLPLCAASTQPQHQRCT